MNSDSDSQILSKLCYKSSFKKHDIFITTFNGKQRQYAKYVKKKSNNTMNEVQRRITHQLFFS